MPPRAARASAKAACDVENVYREWKASPGCRHMAIETDRLFQSSKGSGFQVKFCIKDAVHNKQVLIPLLERLGKSPKLKLPSVKQLAREMLILELAYC